MALFNPRVVEPKLGSGLVTGSTDNKVGINKVELFMK
jgi:hypothetical protein